MTKNTLDRLLKFVIILVSGVYCFNAKAETNWRHVSTLLHGTYYVDYETIIRGENKAEMWHMTDYTKRQVSANGAAYKSAIAQFEYECSERQSRLMELSVYKGRRGNGKLVYNRIRYSHWANVKAGSVEETLWRIACDRIVRNADDTHYTPPLEDE